MHEQNKNMRDEAERSSRNNKGWGVLQVDICLSGNGKRYSTAANPGPSRQTRHRLG